MLELYNTTDRVRRVPKFHYAGQYTIKPKTAIDIEDYMADFYKPWARVGLVVRVRSKNNPKPDESKNVNDAITFDEKDHTGHSGTTAPVTQETVVIGAEKTESIEDKESKENIVDETAQNESIESTSEIDGNIEEETPNKPTYTLEGLQEMGMQELKEIAASLNVVPEDTRKKLSYAEAIMAKVSE